MDPRLAATWILSALNGTAVWYRHHGELDTDAIAGRPEGSFTDAGRILTQDDDPFTIDAHPFRDDDGPRICQSALARSTVRRSPARVSGSSIRSTTRAAVRGRSPSRKSRA